MSNRAGGPPIALDNSCLGPRELAWVEQQAASWKGAIPTRITLRRLGADGRLLFQWLDANADYREVMKSEYKRLRRNARRRGVDPSVFAKQWEAGHGVLKVFSLVQAIRVILEYRRDQSRLRSSRINGTCTKAEIEEIRHAQGNRCVYCHVSFSEVPFERDHKIAVVYGGENNKANLQLLCRRCNRRKGTMADWRFRETLEAEASSFVGSASRQSSSSSPISPSTPISLASLAYR